MCGCLSRTPTGDLAHNLGVFPDWESNQRPFDSQAHTQSTEPHQPGLLFVPLRTHLLSFGSGIRQPGRCHLEPWSGQQRSDQEDPSLSHLGQGLPGTDL